MDLPANQEIVLGSIRGNAIELMAEIETNGAPLVELNVLRSPGKEEYTRIAFYRERGFRDWELFDIWRQDMLAAANEGAGPGFFSNSLLTPEQREKLAEATYSLISIDSAYASLSPDVLSRGAGDRPRIPRKRRAAAP